MHAAIEQNSVNLSFPVTSTPSRNYLKCLQYCTYVQFIYLVSIRLQLSIVTNNSHGGTGTNLRIHKSVSKEWFVGFHEFGETWKPCKKKG